MTCKRAYDREVEGRAVQAGQANATTRDAETQCSGEELGFRPDGVPHMRNGSSSTRPTRSKETAAAAARNEWRIQPIPIYKPS